MVLSVLGNNVMMAILLGVMDVRVLVCFSVAMGLFRGVRNVMIVTGMMVMAVVLLVRGNRLRRLCLWLLVYLWEFWR